MKSGIIIYVAGNAPEDWTESKELQTRNGQSGADRIDIITTRTGHFDISDAWWGMIAKGMSLVTCKLARFDDAGNIEMTGKEMRLCG